MDYLIYNKSICDNVNSRRTFSMSKIFETYNKAVDKSYMHIAPSLPDPVPSTITPEQYDTLFAKKKYVNPETENVIIGIIYDTDGTESVFPNKIKIMKKMSKNIIDIDEYYCVSELPNDPDIATYESLSSSMPPDTFKVMHVGSKATTVPCNVVPSLDDESMSTLPPYAFNDILDEIIESLHFIKCDRTNINDIEQRIVYAVINLKQNIKDCNIPIIKGIIQLEKFAQIIELLKLNVIKPSHELTSTLSSTCAQIQAFLTSPSTPFIIDKRQIILGNIFVEVLQEFLKYVNYLYRDNAMED
jgi:hypothetical protein